MSPEAFRLLRRLPFVATRYPARTPLGRSWLLVMLPNGREVFTAALNDNESAFPSLQKKDASGVNLSRPSAGVDQPRLGETAIALTPDRSSQT